MKRAGFIVVFVGMLTLPALAEVIEPQAEMRRPNAQQQQQNQLQQLITNFYVSDFRTEVKLSDDQFLKMGRFIQSFIQMRFTSAIQKDTVNQQLDQLLSQPNPSSEAVDAAIAQKTRIDRAFVNSEPQFMEKIRADLTTGQIALFYAFNRKFFDEKLPDLIEKARTQTGTPSPAANRLNQNRQRNQNSSGEAFREPVK